MDRASDAVQHYLEVMNLQPGDWETHYNTGNALWESKPPNLVGAIEQFKEALVLNPENADVVYNLANALMENEEFQDSIMLFESLDDASATVMYNLGALYGKIGKDDKARESLEKSIELDPTNDLTRLNLGNLLAKMGDSIGAVREYKKAIGLNPQSFNAHRNLAYSLLEQGELEEGVASLKKVLEIVPDDEEAKTYLEDVERAQQESDKLTADIAAAREAVDAAPESVGTRAKLAQLLHIGEFLEASIAEFEKCLEIQPGHPQLTKMVESVKQELIRTNGSAANSPVKEGGISKFFEEAPSDNSRDRSHSNVSPTNDGGGGFGMFAGKKKGRKMSQVGGGAGGKDALARKGSQRKMTNIGQLNAKVAP
jgi:tetratricopeptide (TPR) repeat protein